MALLLARSSRLHLSDGFYWRVAQSARAKSGQLHEDQIDEVLISSHTYTPDVPDPDLIIRTSGERRMSNFLIWQAAYSEYYFTEVLWPEFSKEDFYQALREFQHRDRRMGRTVYLKEIA